MKPSARSDIAPFYVMEVMRAAEAREAAGHEVLHLEVGQPSTSAPAGALAAVATAMKTDKLGYTGAAGMPELRRAITGWYRDRYGVSVPMERIVVTTGASGSCVLGFMALFDVGDRVAVLEPGYPCYRNDLTALGIEVVTVPVGHESGFRPTIEQLEGLGPIDGLIVASPSNPTGTVLPAETLSAIVAWADAGEVRLVVDEIYHGVTYGAPTPTALAYSDQVIVINSFSKYFSMTGWRLGWVVGPTPIAVAVERLSQSLTIAAPTVSQVAGLAAFDCVEELEANVARYRMNREIVLDGLRRAGLDKMAPPDGAFYAWVDVSAIGIDSPTLCARWLDELGVATTPGIDFDRSHGDRFVRFSYAGTAAELAEAMTRIEAWMSTGR
ncbi:MAG: aminotransferase class I/II-fold pyridoxal phosphate-dependent enzyme [Acidimicrobiales bacterium]